MIYYVEDDANIRELVVYTLNQTGLATRGFSDSAAFFTALQEEKPTLILLDIMLPGEDGLSVLKKIRSSASTTSLPVMMITAKSAEYDKVTGLDLGADDYIAKPFDAKELIARIKAVLRRSTPSEPERTISLPGLTVSLENYAVTLDGRQLEMPPKEIELLYFLASHPGKVFTREQLLEQVWGFDFFGDSRTVDVHVKRIREKLGDNHEWELRTVWGVGYKFEQK